MKTSKLARVQLDKQLGDLKYVLNFTRPLYGWLKTIRNALGMTSRQFAQRMGFEISDGVEFTLAEQFLDFNQFATKKDSDVVLRKIGVFFQSALVGYIYLICSIFSPDPYYAFEGIANSHGIKLHRKRVTRGGGPVVLEISRH